MKHILMRMVFSFLMIFYGFVNAQEKQYLEQHYQKKEVRIPMHDGANIQMGKTLMMAIMKY